MSFPDTLSQSSLLDGECSHCALSGTEVHASRDTTAPPSGRSSCVDTFRETSPVNAEAEDPWLGCEELAREDLLAFLSDYARRRNHADSDAWAVEGGTHHGPPWLCASTPSAKMSMRFGWMKDLPGTMPPSTLHQLLLPWLGCVVGATISPLIGTARERRRLPRDCKAQVAEVLLP